MTSDDWGTPFLPEETPYPCWVLNVKLSFECAHSECIDRRLDVADEIERVRGERAAESTRSPGVGEPWTVQGSDA